MNARNIPRRALRRTASLMALVALGLPGAAVAISTDDQASLWPGYVYPRSGDTSSEWYRFCNTARPNSIAIMNPDNGPGTSQNSDYVTVVNYCRLSGTPQAPSFKNVIGYVKTSYGARSLDIVKAEIDDYYSWYNVDGIFLDEMSNDTSTAPYYAELLAYVHTKGNTSPHVNQDLVVGNPGAPASTSWQLDGYLSYGPAADIVVVSEQQNAIQPMPSWVANKLPNELAILIYDVTSVSSMQTYCASTKSANAGYIYITDDYLSGTGVNPWDSLPTDPYWSSELDCMNGP